MSELDVRGWGRLHAGLSLEMGWPQGRGHPHGRAATGQLWLNRFKGHVTESQRWGAAVSCSPGAVVG